MVSKDFREISASHTHLDKRGRKLKSKLKSNLCVFVFLIFQATEMYCWVFSFLHHTRSTFKLCLKEEWGTKPYARGNFAALFQSVSEKLMVSKLFPQ